MESYDEMLEYEAIEKNKQEVLAARRRKLIQRENQLKALNAEDRVNACYDHMTHRKNFNKPSPIETGLEGISGTALQ